MTRHDPARRPRAVRRAWLHGADAGSELRAARRRRRTRQAPPGRRRRRPRDAATDVAGVLDVCHALVTEHGTNVEACLTTYDATDHTSAGAFDGLR